MKPEFPALFSDSLHTPPAMRILSPETRNRRQTGKGALQEQKAPDIRLPSKREGVKEALPVLPPQYLALSPLLFTGETPVMASFALSHATRWLLEQNAILGVVDAGNVFNPYVIARGAQKARIPAEDWLRRVFVARAFTPYQCLALLENLCEMDDKTQNGKWQKERLASFSPFSHLREGLLILLPFDGLEDSAFSWRERTHLAQRILTCLRMLTMRQTGFVWIVERHSAPFLDFYFHSLRRLVRCHFHGTLADHRLSLRICSRRGALSDRGDVKPDG